MTGEPAPVEIKNPEPIDVKVATPEPTPAEHDAGKAKATAKVNADILRTDDQRRISGIWERTQQVVALGVVFITLLVATIKSIAATMDHQLSTEAGVAFVFLASASNLVIGFYFGRTNHQRVGGVGDDRDEAVGR